MNDVATKVDDGTEHRQVTLRLRQSGIKELIESIGNNGFCSVGGGHVTRVDGEIMFSFCFNVGRHDTKVKAMDLTILVPLTIDEQKYVPADPIPEEGDE